MNAYLTLSYGESALTVSRSKFYGFCRGIGSEEDALGFLAALKKKYADATHICYAYIADVSGSVTRFSDAGEPGGTAGAPILAVLKGGLFKKAIAAVVRYFGGTKLGTGGLAKAYADAAKSAVEAAAPVEMALCTVYEAALSFSDHKKAEKAFTVNGIKVLSVTFTDTVRIMAAVRKDSGVDFAKSLSAVTSGNASVTETGERYERF